MSFLQKLNPNVYVYRPSDGVVSDHSTSPSLILMFGWMDARLQHEQKFIDVLHQRYPTATILLIKSTSGYWVSTQRHLESILRPAIDVLHSRSWDGIIVEILSNGGGFMFTALQKALTKEGKPETDSTSRGPRVALVLDSTPGDHAIQSVLSFAAPRNPLLYILSVPIFVTIYGLWALMNTLGGNAPLFTAYRRALLAPNLLPTITSSSDPRPSRLYVYSAKDRIVRARNVERHVEEAKAMGLTVNVEKYDQTPHVGHMRSDEKRYWDAVDALWARTAV